MKKNLLLLIIFLVVFSCKEEISVSFTEVNSEYNENAIVEINIPSATGNSELSKSINKIVKIHIANILNFSEDDSESVLLKDALRKFDNEYKAFKNDFEESALMWEATFDGEVTYQSSEVISIAITSYLNTGGAHGSMTVTFLNINPSTGELLTPDDVIANKSAFTNLAQHHFKASIQTSDNMIFEDYFFGEDFQLPENIGFNADGVTLFYNVYEIASYAVGITEFTIPYEEVAIHMNVN